MTNLLEWFVEDGYEKTRSSENDWCVQSLSEYYTDLPSNPASLRVMQYQRGGGANSLPFTKKEVLVIIVFASSLHPNDCQNNLLRQTLNNHGKEFVFLNPLDYRDINRIQLVSASGLVKLYLDAKEIVPTIFFHSRLWRTDCVIDFPSGTIYPTLFRQKVNSFLEEIQFSFREVKSFPGKHEDIRLGESKCAVYQIAHGYGLKTPKTTTNSFVKPDSLDYRKVLGFPFSISHNSEMGEEVAVTLLNEEVSVDSNLVGLPWQWQSKINPQKLIRCVVVGERIWVYSLSELCLKGRSLREAQEDNTVLIWEKDNLPSKTKNGLFELLEKLALEYSSPEFLVDENGNYVFIDLNPCGDWFGFMDERDSTEIAEEIVSRL